MAYCSVLISDGGSCTASGVAFAPEAKASVHFPAEAALEPGTFTFESSAASQSPKGTKGTPI